MKHSLGLPTTFLLSDQKQIINVSRLLTHHYALPYEDSYNKHFQYFTQKVASIKAYEPENQGIDLY